MVDMNNLNANLEGCFELSFKITELGNFDARLGITLCIFHNSRDG